MAGTRNLNSISVDLEVLTSDRLRKVIFSLDKSTTDANAEWTINFQLLERDKKSDEFGDPLVKLSVTINAKNHDNAEVTARKGLNSTQADYLLGPASVDAKRLKAGKITQEKANATVERTLPKRDS